MSWPDMHARTLASGMKVIVEPSHAAKVVAAQVWVGVGSADETAEEAGLAHVHEHMLFKGTSRRAVGEIAADVEAAGGDINAYTSFDQTVYHVTIASAEVETALDILADAVLHSAFDASELSRELEVVLEELRRGKDSPSRVASELLFSEVFRVHPYGRPIIGFVETVEKFDRSQILEFYRKWYRPENMMLVVAGDVDPERIFDLASRLFPASASRAAPERPRPPEPLQSEPRFASARMDIQEAHIGVGWPGPALADEDTPAVDVLSVLLGTGESSRLYKKVRRERELVTDCYAYAYTPKEPGMLGLGAQVQGQPVKPALEAMLREAFALRDAPPTRAEVEKAKTIVLAEAVYGIQTVQGRARRLGFFELVAGGVQFDARYREAVARVEPEDVLRVARRWLRPEATSVAVVFPNDASETLDLDAVSSLLSELGPAPADASPDPSPAPAASPSRPPRCGLARVPLELGVTRAQLSCGATVLIQPDRAVPLVSVLAAAPGGLLDETPDRAGVSHLLGELIVRGAGALDAEQIAERCDAMAGGVSGQSGKNSLGLRGEFLRDAWPDGLEIFASCLLEPRFHPDELERERRSALEDLAARADHPSTVAFDHFAKALYGTHPYARPVVGTEAALSALTRDDVLDAYRAQLAPDRLTITVVGDVEVDETLDRLENALGRARRHPEARAFVRPSPPAPPAGPREVQISRDKAQAQLVLGFLGLTLDDDRRHALEVFTQILGSQSGRLFLELRDRQSLAYSVGCFSVEGIDRGYLALHIGTHPDKLPVAEAGMRQQLLRIMDAPPTLAEVQKAQRYLIGSYEIGLQRASARAMTMGLNEAYGVGYDHHARHAAGIRAVTPADVQAVARDLIDLDRVTRVVVAPGVG